jgi:hypothetical protein
MVNSGSTTSSKEYNKAKDGTAIKARITSGKMVQMISNRLEWLNFCTVVKGLGSRSKLVTILYNNQKTATPIKIRKNIK